MRPSLQNMGRGWCGWWGIAVCGLAVLLAAWRAAAGSPAAAARGTILALPMFGGNSPSMDVMAVVGELQQRGYDVVTAVSEYDTGFMDDALRRHLKERAAYDATGATTTPGQHTYVTMVPPGGSFKQVMRSAFKLNKNEGLPIHRILPKMMQVLARPCEALVSNQTAMQAIRRARPDVIVSFGMPFGLDSCACILSHALGGVPFVNADGNPFVRAPLNVPQFTSGLTPKDLETPLGMFWNVLAAVKFRAMFAIINTFTSRWRSVRAAGGVKPARQYGSSCEPILTLLFKDWHLEYPRPLPASHVLLGAGTPRLARPAAQQQQSQPETWGFLEGADPEAGVVLVGFGSTGIFGLSMVAEDYVNLAGAFSDLAPTRVLWALLPTNLPDGLRMEDLPLRPNVLVVPWVDYNDVLGHPATKLFITHCGVHSMWEAAFHGVPIIGVPFQREQVDNARKLAGRGMGEVCKEAVAFRSARKQLVYQRRTVADLARKVLTTPSYRANAAAVAAKMQLHASFRHPVQRAADEVEVLLAGAGPPPPRAGTGSSSRAPAGAAAAAAAAGKDEL